MAAILSRERWVNADGLLSHNPHAKIEQLSWHVQYVYLKLNCCHLDPNQSILMKKER